MAAFEWRTTRGACLVAQQSVHALPQCRAPANTTPQIGCARIMALVPSPSAVSRMIQACQACFWGLLGSAATRGTLGSCFIDDDPVAHLPDPLYRCGLL